MGAPGIQAGSVPAVNKAQTDGVSSDGAPQTARLNATSSSDTWRAWLVHAFTVVGIVAGLKALVSVFDGDPRAAIAWLLVAAVIDGVDGPIARMWGVAENLPMIDGCTLDVVVDFIGCVVVPLAFLWRFEMLPAGVNFLVVSVAFVTSALWFARTDLMTADNWFNGFPTAWNLMIPTMFLLHTGTWFNAAFVTFLAILQMTSVKFVHPVRVAEGRRLTLLVTLAWFVAIAVETDLSPHLRWWGTVALLVGPCYQAGLSARRSLAGPPSPRLPLPSAGS